MNEPTTGEPARVEPILMAVEVEWLDAAQHGGWRTFDENRERTCDLIVSVGYLLVNDDDRIVLLQSRQREGDLGADTVTIPRSTVISVTYLEAATTYEADEPERLISQNALSSHATLNERNHMGPTESIHRQQREARRSNIMANPQTIDPQVTDSAPAKPELIPSYEPIPPFFGVARPVALSVTIRPDGSALWTATSDDYVEPNHPVYFGGGETPAEACANLARTLASRAEVIANNDV